MLMGSKIWYHNCLKVPLLCKAIIIDYLNLLNISQIKFFESYNSLILTKIIVKPITVSIVENNIAVQRHVMDFIGLQVDLIKGYSFESAEQFLSSGLDFDQSHINTLLLDISLPGMSGIEAIPFILKKWAFLNIIMLTVAEDEEIILKAISSGACSYLSKTATLNEIADAIHIVARGGSYMSPVIAREIVNHLMGARHSKMNLLTERQKEILQMLADSKSYQEIADELFVSIETVRSHVKKMYRLLQVNNKTEAVMQLIQGKIR